MNLPQPSSITEAIRLIYPEAEAMAISRLVADGNLYNCSQHRLRGGLTKEKARAVLLLASLFAKESGLVLSLSGDEKKLMKSKFDF